MFTFRHDGARSMSLLFNCGAVMASESLLARLNCTLNTHARVCISLKRAADGGSDLHLLEDLLCPFAAPCPRHDRYSCMLKFLVGGYPRRQVLQCLHHEPGKQGVIY